MKQNRKEAVIDCDGAMFTRWADVTTDSYN
jgi:hypothetical protein